MRARAEITLLTQQDCAFCDRAKDVLRRVGQEHPLRVTEIDLAEEEGQRLAKRAGVMFAPGCSLTANRSPTAGCPNASSVAPWPSGGPCPGKRRSRKMASSDCPYLIAAGCYLLRALELADETAFVRHLTWCRACQAEIDNLAPVVRVLDGARRERRDRVWLPPNGDHG